MVSCSSLQMGHLPPCLSFGAGLWNILYEREEIVCYPTLVLMDCYALKSYRNLPLHSPEVCWLSLLKNSFRIQMHKSSEYDWPLQLSGVCTSNRSCDCFCKFSDMRVMFPNVKPGYFQYASEITVSILYLFSKHENVKLFDFEGSVTCILVNLHFLL